MEIERGADPAGGECQRNPSRRPALGYVYFTYTNINVLIWSNPILALV